MTDSRLGRPGRRRLQELLFDQKLCRQDADQGHVVLDSIVPLPDFFNEMFHRFRLEDARLANSMR